MPGEVICTTAMCAQGRASVEEMSATFSELSNDPEFDRGRFEPTVRGIESAFEDSYSMFSEWIPFNPACCAVKDLGAQADRVTADMLESVGAVSPGPGPGTSPPPADFGSLITLAGIGLAFYVAVNVFPLLKKQ